MSLLRNHEMTEKKLAAIRRNQKLSHGPVTDEGRARIRAAHLRHGFYAQAEEVALRDLGEDPSQFQDLLGGFWEEYDPVGASQEGLVIRLARATWLMNRADRMQEGYAVRQAQDVSSGRHDRLHAKMMRLKMTEERLRRLAQSVATEHYVTPREDLEKIKRLHEEGMLKDMGEIALALFCELQAPGTDEDGIDGFETARRMVEQAKEIFGIGRSQETKPDIAANPSQPLEEGRDARYPSITPAGWEARERPRQLLENILRRQVEACEAQRNAILKESLKGPSPYERAAEIAPAYPSATHLRRMQDSYFREVRRVTNLLLKLKRHQRHMETFSSDYVDDNKDS
jgi:hypothetical protein